MLFAGEQQKLAQLIAEEFCARRIFECEGCKRIDHPESTGYASIQGFNAEDTHHDIGELIVGETLETLRMCSPELGTLLNALRRQELCAVFMPWPHAFGGPRHGVDDRLLDFRAA